MLSGAFAARPERFVKVQAFPRRIGYREVVFPPQKRETLGPIHLLTSLQGIDAEHGGFAIVKVHQFDLIG